MASLTEHDNNNKKLASIVLDALELLIKTNKGNSTLADLHTHVKNKLQDAMSPAKKGVQGGARRRNYKTKRGGADIDANILNVGDLIQDNNDPLGFASSPHLSSITNVPPAVTGSMKLSNEPQTLLPSGGFNIVDPPLRAGGGKKIRRKKTT